MSDDMFVNVDPTVPRHKVLATTEAQAKKIATFLDEREEFYISGWGCYLQIRPIPGDNIGHWLCVTNDTSGG